MATKTSERKLRIVIKAVDSFTSTFTKASSLAKSTASVITKSFKTATIAVVGTSTAVFALQGSIVVLASSVAKTDDAVGKLSLRLGASTEALSEYAFVAELTGVRAETLNTAWQRQARRISQAAKGTGEAKKALKELNLAASDMIKLSPEDQFEAIADAMLSVENQGDKMRIAMQIWDTEGVSLLQTIEGGSSAIKSMRAEAKLLGLSLSNEQAQNAAEYNDAMARLGATFQGLKRTIIQEVLPELTVSFIKIKEKITEFLPTIRKVISTAITVVLNFPTAIGLISTAVKGLFSEMISDSAEAGTGVTELFIKSFSLIGPAMGKITVQIASVVWIPLVATFDVMMANINAKYFSFLIKFRITSREFAKKIAENFGASRAELERLQSGIDDLKKQLEPIKFSDAFTAAVQSVGEQLDDLSTGSLADVAEGFQTLGFLINLAFEQGANSPALIKLKSELDALSKKTKAIGGGGGGAGGRSTLQTAATTLGPVPFESDPSIDAAIELQDLFDFMAEQEEKRFEFRKNNGLSFFDFETDLVRKRMETQKQAAALDIDLTNKVAQTAAINAFKRSESEKAAAGITNAANKSMETQLLSFVETGKFSANEFAKVVVQQAKAELIGISARAAVQALFQTGLGFAAAATSRPRAAALHFAAAGQFAAISGAALAGAAVVQGATAGTTSGNSPTDSLQSTSPVGQTTTGAPIGQNQQQQPAPIITINITNPIGSEDWDKIAREEIIPALNRGGENNFQINSTVIREV